MSSSSGLDGKTNLSTRIEELLTSAALNDVPIEDLQRLLAAAIRVYSTRVENLGGFPIVPEGSLTATDAMIAATALLRATNVAVFELGCWQHWAG